MQRLGIDVGIVEGMLTGRLDALHLEGQPATIARRIGEELNVVVCGGNTMAIQVLLPEPCAPINTMITLFTTSSSVHPASIPTSHLRR